MVSILMLSDKRLMRCVTVFSHSNKAQCGSSSYRGRESSNINIVNVFKRKQIRPTYIPRQRGTLGKLLSQPLIHFEYHSDHSKSLSSMF